MLISYIFSVTLEFMSLRVRSSELDLILHAYFVSCTLITQYYIIYVTWCIQFWFRCLDIIFLIQYQICILYFKDTWCCFVVVIAGYFHYCVMSKYHEGGRRNNKFNKVASFFLLPIYFFLSMLVNFNVSYPFCTYILFMDKIIGSK